MNLDLEPDVAEETLDLLHKLEMQLLSVVAASAVPADDLLALAFSLENRDCPRLAFGEETEMPGLGELAVGRGRIRKQVGNVARPLRDGEYGQVHAAAHDQNRACNRGKAFGIEGLAEGEKLHPLQRKFLEHAALQCGVCTPGFLVAAKALLEHNPDPDETDVRYWLAGNLCRCTGYDKIVRAVLDAAQEVREANHAA